MNYINYDPTKRIRSNNKSTNRRNKNNNNHSINSNIFIMVNKNNYIN